MKNFLKINRALVAKKKVTLLFALLCASAMGWASIAQNTNFWGDHNFQWQEISGIATPADVRHVESHSGFDCLYITFADAGFNRDYIVGGTVFTDAGAQAWLKLESFTDQYTDVLFYETGSTTNVRWGLRIYNPNGTPAASCASNHLPVVSGVTAASNITYNSAQVTITASDEDGDAITYVVKNGGVQIASSSSSTLTLSGLTPGTTYDALKVYAVDACGISADNENNTIASFTTDVRPSQCSGDLGHWGNPSVKRISYTIEYLPIIDKIKYTVRGYNTEVLNYLQIRVASPTVTNSGDVSIVDGVATWFQNAPAAGTEMAVQFYYGLVSMGEGREITQDGEVSLSNPQSVYYKSHDCSVSGGPSTVPAAPDDKNDCQVYGILGTAGFASAATHAEWWDGAMSYLTGNIGGNAVYYTTRGTTANIQYPSKNISAYDKLHFDIWTDAAREIGVELCINAGTHGAKQNIPTVAGEWKSVDLDLTDFHADKDVNTTFLLLSSLARATYYVTNVYLYKTAADESCYADLNLALNKPVVAGYTPNNGNEAPTKVNDGNHDTEWTTWQNQPTSKEWWYVDLGHIYQLTHIDVLFNGDRSTNYILQTRLNAPTEEDQANDAAWTTVATVTDAVGNTMRVSTVDCAARYVRFHSLARSNNDLLRLKEIEVYGSGIADVDMEAPVMTSATLVSNTDTRVVIAVAATDNEGIAKYHVVDTDNGINEELSAVTGEITLNDLTQATEYTFTITAKDYFGNESANTKTVNVTTDAHLTAPAAACQAPSLDENLMRIMYSPTYNVDYTHQDWSSGTIATTDEFGRKYVTNANGYFGASGFTLNCIVMQKLHYDIWIENDATIRFVPIWGGAEQGITKNLTGQQWNSIDIDLTDYTGITNWGNIYQMKIDQAANLTFWVANAYFYRESAIVDTEAPTNVTASVNAEGFYSVKITAQAEDNSGAVSFKVMNGEEILATGAAVTDVATTITVNNLNPGTAYNFNVVAYDEANNEAAPVAVAATTKVIPASAPAPVTSGKVIVPVYSDAIAGSLTGIQSGNWGETTVYEWLEIAPNDHVFYAQNFNFAGWHSWGASINATDMTYLHVDFYSTAMTQVSVTPISPGHEGVANCALTPNAWTSVDVPLSSYSGIDWSDIFQFKFMGAVGGNELMIDNVYFWSYGVTTNQDNWSTFASAVNVQVPSGITAYKAAYSNSNGDEVLTLTALSDGIIPAGKGVILKSEVAETTHIFTPTATAAATDMGDNSLTGCVNRTDVSSDRATNDIFCMRRSDLYDQTGFFLYEGQYVPAGKAYLALPKPSQPSSAPRHVRFVINNEQTTTGMENVQGDKVQCTKYIENGQLFIRRGEAVYTIQGVRVK